MDKSRGTGEGKLIRDSLQWQFRFSRESVDIIDTLEFQRLRSIKQTGGLEFLYPGAVHNRFTHSLGTAHLALRFLKSLRERQPELGIGTKDLIVVEIAGLCHDLGHGPYSHTWEAFHNYGLKKRGLNGPSWKHEYTSVAILDYIVRKHNLLQRWKTYPEGITQSDVDLIKRIILGQPLPEDAQKAYLFQIVNNSESGLDVDKWDYYMRDAHHCGLELSFDQQMLIDNARIIDHEGCKTICFRDKNVDTVYDMFRVRFDLYKKAYSHSFTIMSEQMFVEAVYAMDLDDYLKRFNIPPLWETTHRMTSQVPSDEQLCAFISLTDTCVEHALNCCVRLATAVAASVAEMPDGVKMAAELYSAILQRSSHPRMHRRIGTLVCDTNDQQQDAVISKLLSFLPAGSHVTAEDVYVLQFLEHCLLIVGRSRSVESDLIFAYKRLLSSIESGTAKKLSQDRGLNTNGTPKPYVNRYSIVPTPPNGFVATDLKDTKNVSDHVNLLGNLVSRFSSQARRTVILSYPSNVPLHSNDFNKEQQTAGAPLSTSDNLNQVRGSLPVLNPSQTEISNFGVEIKPVNDFAHKLSGDVVPDHYNVELKIVVNTSDTVQHKDVIATSYLIGNIRIQLLCVRDTKTIVIHSVDLSIPDDKIFVEKHNDPDKKFEVIGLDYNLNEEVVHIKLSEALEANHHYTLSMHFAGKMSLVPKGLFMSIVRLPNTIELLMVGSYMRPTYARRVFPCFDEPGILAKFSLTLMRPKNLISISNMQQKKQEFKYGNYISDIYETTPPMPAYLLSIAVGPLFKTVLESSRPKVNIYSVSQVNSNNYIFRVVPKVMSFYNDVFGVHHDKLSKLDITYVPGLPAKGVEGLNSIYFKDNVLFLDLNEAHSGEIAYITKTIAHHVAQQWMGTIVPIFWWNTFWLKEGLNRYFSYFAADVVDNTTPQLASTLLIEQTQLSMEYDSLPDATPLVIPYNSARDIQLHLGVHLPIKAAAIFRMMVHLISSEYFEKAVKILFTKYSSKPIVSEHFYAILNAIQPLSSESYVNYTDTMIWYTHQGGVPLITVNRNYSAKNAEVIQTPFYFFRSEFQPQKTWQLPLTWTSQGEKAFHETRRHYWLRTKNMSLNNMPEPQHWIIFNLQAVGYYRVNYDVQNWKLLIEQLNRDHLEINELNRAQLVDDSLDLARAGIINYGVVFSLLEYLPKDSSPLPWMSAFNNFEKLEMILRNLPGLDKWRRFVARLLSVQYEFFVSHEKPLGSIVLAELRIRYATTSCQYKLPACINRARKFLQDLKSDFGLFFTEAKSLRAVILCQAIKVGEKTDFYYMLNNYHRITSPVDRAEFVKALSCTEDEKLLQVLLMSIVNKESSNITMKSRVKADGVKANHHATQVLDIAHKEAISDAIFRRKVDYALRHENFGLLQEIRAGLDQGNQRWQDLVHSAEHALLYRKYSLSSLDDALNRINE